MGILRPVTLTVAAVILATFIAPAGADYVPGPGQLHVVNDLATQAGGGCSGGLSTNYGLKAIQRPAGAVLEILSNCTVVVRWAQSGPTATPLATAIVVENKVGVDYGVDGEYTLMTAWTRTAACWAAHNDTGVYYETGSLQPVYLTVQKQNYPSSCTPNQHQLWTEDGTLLDYPYVNLWHQSSAAGVKCEGSVGGETGYYWNGEADFCFFWANNDLSEPDPARVATTVGDILGHVVAGDDALISGL